MTPEQQAILDRVDKRMQAMGGDPASRMPSAAPAGSDFTPEQMNILDRADQRANQPPPAASYPPEEEVFRASVLPYKIMQNEQGKYRHAFAVPEAARSIGRVATLPGEMKAGKIKSTDELIARTEEAAEWLSPIGPAARALRTTIRSTRPGPTIPELKKAGGAGYQRTREMGVEFSVPHVNRMAADTAFQLDQRGLSSRRVPQTHEILKELQKEGDVATWAGIDNAKQELKNIIQTARDPRTGEPLPEAAAAASAINELNKFTENTPRGGVLRGPVEAARKEQRDARANIAASKRAQMVEGRTQKGELQAMTSHSGKNVDNAIRQQIKWILDPLHPERLHGFSDKEKAGLSKIAEGSKSINATRNVANLLGGGGGLGRAVTAGGGFSLGGALGSILMPGPIGAMIGSAVGGTALPAAGAGLKGLENAATRRAAARASEMVRQRSPLYERMQAETPENTQPVGKQAMMLRLLQSGLEGDFRSRENLAKQNLIEALLNGT